MRKINIILSICLCLLIAISFIQCKTSKCQSKKIELLLEDIFRKKEYYYIYGSPKSIDSSDDFDEPIDSSMYFIYLNSTNLKIPDKEFYLHIENHTDTAFPDSVKLREINDLSVAYLYNYKVGINLLEVNEDTTKLKISVAWLKNIFLEEITFTYLFDEKNCKWTVLETKKWQY